MKLPKIRKNLLVQDLADEVLIYDQSTNKSYCLNDTAKTVFNACNGVKTFADLDLPEDIIYLSLDELKKQNLIEDNFVSPFVGINRRKVVRKIGLASMVMLPVILTMIAPTATNATSRCVGNGTIASGNPAPGALNSCQNFSVAPCNGACNASNSSGCCSGMAQASSQVSCSSTASLASVLDL